MDLSLPDKPYKLSASLGLFTFGYCIHSIQTSYNLYQLKVLESNVNRDLLISIYNDQALRMLIFAILGLILAFFSIIKWHNNEETANIIPQDKKLYYCCQSCGKTFSSMRIYGLNSDSTINYAFCNICYKDGSFTNPDLSVEILLLEAKNKNYKDKNKFIFTSLEVRLNSLERWKTDEY